MAVRTDLPSIVRKVARATLTLTTRIMIALAAKWKANAAI
jgi:hypothetical protein